jgi:hypothetical protein
MFFCMIASFVPVPTGDLHAHWREWGWDPEKQERLLGELGDLAVQMPWTGVQRERWEQRYSARPALMQAINTDLQAVRMVDPDSPAYFVTRQILAD